MNKINIIGDIDDYTPRCVIYEIFQSLSYKTDLNNISEEYISKIINKIKCSTMKLNTGDDMARFVSNKNESWNPELLEEAMSHVMMFYDNENIPTVSISDNIGPKTNKSPKSFDSCLLYKSCIANNIHTDRSTSIYQMFFSLIDTEKAYNAIRKSIERNIPCDKYDAIKLGFKKYNINLSFFDDPEQEYMNYAVMETFKEEKSIILTNYCPDYLNIDKVFSSGLISCYNNEELSYWASKEGFEGKDGDCRGFLEGLEDDCHVYVGIHPAYIMENEKARTCINFDDISPGDANILTFGVVSKPETLEILSIDELTSLYDNSRFLLSPSNINIKLSDEAINKLLLMDDTLLTLLINEITISSGDNAATECLTCIKDSSETDLMQIRLFFILLKDLIYYMRGWKINDNQNEPLELVNTNKEGVDFDQLEKNVGESYSKIIKYMESLDENIHKFIKSIPLLFMMNSSKGRIFEPVQSEEQKTTIIGRLDMVFSDPGNENSCLRTSSNLLAYSLYYYLEGAFSAPPFDINKLELIV